MSSSTTELVGGLVTSFNNLAVSNSRSADPLDATEAASASATALRNVKTKPGSCVTRQDCFKKYSLYKCTNIKCRKNSEGWKSAHGWEDGGDRCEFCNKEARVVKKENENDCQLDLYVCHRCKNRWDCLHDPQTEEVECDQCETMVQRSGTQQRFAVHYWYECNGCSLEWEAAKSGRTFSQRCSACHSEGIIVGTRQETKEERAQRIALAQSGWVLRPTSGTHDIAGCDMCQHLISKGGAPNCTRSRHVRIAETENGNLEYSTSIIRLK